MQLTDLIQNRRSVRTYREEPIPRDLLNTLMAYAQTIENPYGEPVSFRLLPGREHGLNCPVTVGTDLFAAGKIKKSPYAFEAFGYSFECFVLKALELGLGTVWLGGTMNRSAFEKAMELAPEEIMPCATPLGFIADKPSLRDSVMRKSIKADDRLPFEELFFRCDWTSPLTSDAAGDLKLPLSMVRLAPSAVNRQPWRVLVKDGAVHFYLKRTKGFNPGAVDMQKIDLGIALCHFDLVQKDLSLGFVFSRNDPGIPGEGLEYIASFVPQK